jgi:hypothetical protein
MVVIKLQVMVEDRFTYLATTSRLGISYAV